MKKNIIYLVLLISLISCNSTKKTIKNEEIKKNSEVSYDSIIQLIKKQMDLVKVKIATDNSSSLNSDITKTKVILTPTKDTLTGKYEKSTYSYTTNNQKTDVSISGKGEVIIETENKIIKETENYNKYVDSLNLSSLNESTNLNKNLNSKEDYNLNSKELNSKKATNIIFQWWFWLIILILFIIYLFIRYKKDFLNKIKSKIWLN